MRYVPASSLTTVRTFSISTGLDASTVTPGSTPPDESLTTPAIEAWAYTMPGNSMIIAITYEIRSSRLVTSAFFLESA